MEVTDYYTVLGVDKDASAQQIKEAFRQKAFEFHPDRNQGNEVATGRMKAINEAYAVLSNTRKRMEYDTLRQHYGNAAYDRFRQTHSDQDIFRNSDLSQVFEEIAKSFGLRGVEEIFKEVYGKSYRKFEFRQPGFFAKGFVFWGGGVHPKVGRQAPGVGLLGYIAQKLIQNLTGQLSPKTGQNIHDVIELDPDFAIRGGPYNYSLRQRNKKLVVKIPAGVRNGQLIRLAGMGQVGLRGGANGDLLLKLKIRVPLLDRIKSLIGFEKADR